MNTKNMSVPAYIRLCQDFKLWAKTIGYASKQPDAFASAVAKFLLFLEKNAVYTLKSVHNNHVIRFHQYVCNRKHPVNGTPLTSATIRQYLSILRLFFNYLVDIGEVDEIPNHLYCHVKVTYKRRNIITVDEFKQLLYEAKSCLEKALLCCAYGCGLRRSEIVRLNIRDIDLNNQTLLVRYAKMHKTRMIPLTNQILLLLRSYLHKYRFRMKCRKNSDALFMHKNGIRMSGYALNSILKKLIVRTNNNDLIQKGITLHCLRHSIATHLLNNGAPIEFVMDFLGHSNIDSTNLYAINRRIQNKMIKALQI